jgi:hypothetical protein
LFIASAAWLVTAKAELRKTLMLCAKLASGRRLPSRSMIRLGPRPPGKGGPRWVITQARSAPRPTAVCTALAMASSSMQSVRT